jgi:hypothetical protein
MSANLSKHTLGLTQLQSGEGTPNHIAKKGSLYIDVLTSDYYKNTDGNTSWVLINTGSTGDYLPLSGGTVTGATSFNSGLTANTIYTDYVDFNTGATVTQSTGRVSWDSGTGTLNVSVGDDGTGFIDLQVGQEEIVRVYNSEATTLLRGEIVYVFGSQGNRPSVKRAVATSDGYSVTTLGMVSSDITSGSQGYVTTFGIISNLNTLGLSGGTPIFLSPTISGGYTSTKPQAPNHIVLIGYVVRVSATVGSVFVNISNGWELDEIHDVRISATTTGDLLMRSSYSGTPVWINTKTLEGSYTINGDLTITGETSSNSITGNTISGGTFYGDGINLTNVITGATSLGGGNDIYSGVSNKSLEFNTITGDSLNKITTTLTSNLIEVGINEQNLSLWPLVVSGNRLIEGSISYVSGLTFDISPLKYIIDGQIYNITGETQVILNSGDSVYDRIDVVYADVSGNTGVLEGTPSSNPEKPLVDSTTQVEVTFISIPASSETASITTTLIYDENTGPPTEWSFSKFGIQSFRISGDSTNQAYTGTKSISVSGLTTSGGSYSNGFSLSSATATDTNQFATLEFAIRNMSANSTNTYVLIQFLGQTGNVLNTSNVWIYGGGASGNYIPYNPSNVSSWQLISIPIWRFYLSNTNVYGIKFSYLVGSTVARHYFDRIRLVEGSASSPPTNSWTIIRGDATSPTITAPNPNSTLLISGGTNIGSRIVSPSSVVLDLDGNIRLTGVTATTISAQTYQNIQISSVNNLQTSLNDKFDKSGGTVTGDVIVNGNVTILGTATTINTETLLVKDNVITLNSNYSGGTPFFGDSGIEILRGSATTASLIWSELNSRWEAGLTGLTKQILLSGDSLSLLTSGHTHPISEITNLQTSLNSKLDLSGGTVTGATSFTDGLTANTISATTYQNLPTDVYVTGGTYSASSSTIIFTNNTGGTFNVTGITSTGGGTFTGGTVTGSTSFTNGLTANTISATTYQNLPTDIRVTGASYSNNTFTYTNNTGGTFSVLFNTLTGLTVNGNLTVTGNTSLQSLTAGTSTINGNLSVTGNTSMTGTLSVTGNTNIRSFTGTSGYISGSGQNILTVIGSGNSTTSPLFTVQGSSGELFSVTDSLTGSLFSVNDISGLPILEVFSNNTILQGSYLSPSLNTTVKTSLTAGTNSVYSIPTSAYTGAFFDYTLISTGSTGARAGTIMSIWSGSTTQYTDVSTNDIGTTTGVTFSVAVSGSNAVLSSSATTTGWTLKTIVRSI